MRALIVVAVTLIMLVPFIIIEPVASADEPKLELSTGTTDTFWGGDYVAIKSGTKAWFGVIYGTAANPGPIRIVSLHTRYIGGADVYGEKGRLISENIGIPVESIAAQVLTNIYEFQDANNNSLFDYSVAADWWGDISHSDPVYKRATLNTAWTLSTPQRTDTGWTFSLSASNLSYLRVGLGGGQPSGKLESLMFTFHIGARSVESNVTLPWYKITVSNGAVSDSEQVGTRSMKAERLSADFKLDHYIQGWDFDPANTGPTRGLILEAHTLLGFGILPAVASWIKEQFVNNLNASGSMQFSDANGTREKVSEGNPSARLGSVSSQGIAFQDTWQRYGAFTWVSNVSVYPDENSTSPVQDSVVFQVTGARRMSILNWKGAGSGLLATVLLSGGFVYPGGAKLIHDPTFSAVAQLVEWGKALIQLLPKGIVMFQLLVAVVAAVVAGGIAVSRRRRKKPEER